MKSMTISEHMEQAAIMDWASVMELQYPELELLHAVPNGGKREKRTAAKLKREGVRPGVPDLFLPVPRSTYHGLFIEVKTARGRVSPPQRWWIAALLEQGYYACVCRGAREAIVTITAYLKGEL